VPYRSPFAVAKAVASLDRVSNGRAVFGAGSGYLQREFEILGVPFEDRGERTDEAIRVVVVCWTEERPEFPAGTSRSRAPRSHPDPCNGLGRRSGYGAAAAVGSHVWIASEYTGHACNYTDWGGPFFAGGTGDNLLGTCGGASHGPGGRTALANWSTFISEFTP
jgi:alkanesulfonate monooxygenase SsuD/methylene tetrahydromethanopterin reductase-like flavin-dependent oxidoreductase (luciferase family)